MITRSRISLEYVTVTVTADVDFDTQPVELAIVANGVIPGDTDWLDVAWQGEAGTSRQARVLVGPGGELELEDGTYYVWVRITDDPEIPAFIADTLRII